MTTIAENIAQREPQTPPLTLHMTMEEFEAWAVDDVHAEFINGEVFPMSPVTGFHNDIQSWLVTIMNQIARKQDLGIVRGPQFGLSFPNKRFEPDVMFIRKTDIDLVTGCYFTGRPGIVIEIVSPESAARDWHHKFKAYEQGGVEEYWIIDPASKRCECYSLVDGSFVAVQMNDGKITSAVMTTFYIRPEWLWSAILPDPFDICQEFGLIKLA